MADDAREAERQALTHEIALLQEMASGAGSSPEIEQAVQERRERIQRLDSGATPRGHGGSGSSTVSAGGSRGLSQEQLREVFEFYCNFGRSAVMTYQDSLDSFMFMKFARECPGLLDESLTTTEVDLIFIKAKPKFERRLDFDHFLDALAAIAERKYPELSPRDGLRQLISQHLAPHYDMVQIEMTKTGETEIPLHGVFKKLYDPRSYTGVYAERFRTGDGRINGESDHRPGRSYKGSTNTGTDEIIHDVSVLMRPNLHGAGTMLSPSNHLLYRKTGMAGGATPKSKPTSPTLSRTADRPQSAYTSSPRYASSSSSISADSHHMASSPVAASSARLPSDPAAQQEALRKALAKAQSGDPSELMSLTVALADQVKKMQGGGDAPSASPAARPRSARSDGGSAAAMRAEVEELEQDISDLKAQLEDATAHASRNGGPTQEDADYIREVTEAIKQRRNRLQDLVSGAAKPAAVGTPGNRPKSAGSSPRFGAGASGGLGLSGGLMGATARSGGGMMMDGNGSVASSSAPAINQEQLREVFEFYCNFGRSAIMTYQDSLDSFMFMKFARECPDLMDRRLTATEVDLIFTKAKPKFERRLLFTHFLDALSAMAERKYPDVAPVEGLRLLLANHLAPHYDMVQIEMTKTGETEIPLHGVFKKLYDPRSYTGVYAERFRTGDGRINGESDNRPGRQFSGNTNTATDEIIHDISVLMRPNLRSGTMMKSRPITAGGSPRKLARSVSPRQGRSPSMDGRSVASGMRGR